LNDSLRTLEVHADYPHRLDPPGLVAEHLREPDLGGLAAGVPEVDLLEREVGDPVELPHARSPTQPRGGV
jgi:hypothetical protein